MRNATTEQIAVGALRRAVARSIDSTSATDFKNGNGAVGDDGIDGASSTARAVSSPMEDFRLERSLCRAIVYVAWMQRIGQTVHE